MSKKHQHTVTVIRHSCITGKVVWLYRGPSVAAANRAYCRVCKREVGLMSQWPEMMSRRKANILRLLNDCMASASITGEIPKEKQEAARRLVALSESPPACYRDFYNHIIEQRRRRKEDMEIRRQMRLRNSQN